MSINNGKGGGQQSSGGHGMGPAGSSICICPKCGYQEGHQRGTPCQQALCPKCGTFMKGEICSS